MKETTYTVYSQDADMTFIIKETSDKMGNLTSTEVTGFYYGEPNAKSTEQYAGKLKAIF